MVVGRFSPRQLSHRAPKAFSKAVLSHRIALASSPATRSSRGPSSFATSIKALAQRHEHSRLHRYTVLVSRIRRAVSHRIAVPQQRTGYHQPGFEFLTMAHARLMQRPAWSPSWKPVSSFLRSPPPSAARNVNAVDLWGPQCPMAPSLSSAVADHKHGLTAYPSLNYVQMEVEIPEDHLAGVGSSVSTTLRPRRSLPCARYRPYPAHRPQMVKRRKVTHSMPSPANKTRVPDVPPVSPQPTPTPWRGLAEGYLDDDEEDVAAEMPEVSLEPRLGRDDAPHITGGLHIMSLYPSPPTVVRPIPRTWPVTELGRNLSLHYGVDVQSRIVQGPLDRPDGMPVYVEDPVREIPIFSVGGRGWGIPGPSLPQSPSQPAVSVQVPIKRSIPVNSPPTMSSRPHSHRGKEAQQYPRGEPVFGGPVPHQRLLQLSGGKENWKPPQEALQAPMKGRLSQERGRRARVR